MYVYKNIHIYHLQMFSFLTKFINNNDYDKILDNLFIGNISASNSISDLLFSV